MVTRAKTGVFKPKIYQVRTSSVEPLDYKQALSYSNWFKAMQSEYNVLITNNTWTLMPLPPGVSVVGCKWIFKFKLHADRIFLRNKARLVAKGFTQVPDLDYSGTFSPVVRPTTI